MAFESRHRKTQDKKPPKSKKTRAWENIKAGKFICKRAEIEERLTDQFKRGILEEINLLKAKEAAFRESSNIMLDLYIFGEEIQNRFIEKVSSSTQEERSKMPIYQSLIYTQLYYFFKYGTKTKIRDYETALEVLESRYQRHDCSNYKIMSRKHEIERNIQKLKVITRNRHEKGAVNSAFAIFCNINKDAHVTKRTFQNWLAGINQPKGFPGIGDLEVFAEWCRKDYMGRKPWIESYRPELKRHNQN